MVDRSTRCISELFGFLKEVEHCENCDPNRSSEFRVQNEDIVSTSKFIKKSVSDTKLLQSQAQSQPQIVRKCICNLRQENALAAKGNTVSENSTIENGTMDNHETQTVSIKGEKSVSIDPGKSDVAKPVVSSRQQGEVTSTSGMEDVNVDKQKTDVSDSGSHGNTVNGIHEFSEEEEVSMRPKLASQEPSRTNTQVVSDVFSFLRTESDTGDEGTRVQDHIEKLSEMVKKEDLMKTSSCSSAENTDSACCASVEVNTSDVASANDADKTNSDVAKIHLDGEKTNVSIDGGKGVTCENISSFEVDCLKGAVPNGSESENVTKILKDETAVRENGCEHLSEVVKDENRNTCEDTEGNVFDDSNVSDTVARTDAGASADGSKDVARSDKIATGGNEDVVLRRRQSSKKSEGDYHSDDSSDEDTGIYAESFRNSKWIRIDEDEEMGDMKFATLPAPRKKLVKGVVDGRSASASDDVFTESHGSPPLVRSHKRSDSSTTTLSESEFKRQYTSRRKCLIQRDDSQQEYHRLSHRFYDQEKVVIIEKQDSESGQDFGLHILDCQPAYITSIDPGSPAERSGVKEGQILISVNGVNVLEASHDEIVKLMQQNPAIIKLEVAYSDFQPVRDLQASVMSGCMYKLGNSALMKTWKKRFFVLRQDNCLYYYKNEQEQIPLGAVPLAGYSISRYIDTNKDFCFKADKYGARSYYFMTDSRDEMTQWVGKMTEASARSKKRKDSWLDVSSHNVGLPALEIRRPESTGYLTKMGRQRKVWKKRYCVLKDACIYYYKLMSSHSAQGVAHLHGYTVDVNGLPGRRHSFVLKPPEQGMRTFYFCAENETDKARWVDSMKRSIQRWVKVDTK
ncbi:uncharacterized protein LOC124147843 isoform X1 [Haliotis rufescens]|uniref:uncharacterized protein LOC124147843 isoform X1 n=1 Tax=Haliotis rufescens TaxID=6454 RepID=UPI00201E7519|nr:uncharacterized protein LOC124147843 isoform X1 [Haliotis rufescens]XP_046374593.2 uncharacterized protein LOC124147843 isoform X1 [Haliotis rufescens]